MRRIRKKKSKEEEKKDDDEDMENETLLFWGFARFFKCPLLV
jgi:hypothetical protein